jgi:hypothetical protein
LARLLFVAVFTAATPLALVAAAGVSGVPLMWLTRDATAVGEVHPLTGFLSSLGILLWGASATLCLFTAFALRAGITTEVFRFLLASGLLAAFLLFDDLFLVHEALAPRYLGMDERLVYAAIVFAAASYALRFRRVIARLGSVTFPIAVVLLASSLFMDVALGEPLDGVLGQWLYFVEDGAKWLGIVSWCAFCADACLRLFAERLEAPGIAAVTAGGAGAGLLAGRRQPVERQREDRVDGEQLYPLHPVRLAVLRDDRHDPHADPDGHDLQRREAQVHRLGSDQVAQEDEHRRHEQGDLDR